MQTATNLFADPRCEESVVFCTAGATERHGAGLVAEFSANGLPQPRLVPIPDGASEAQLWEIFRIVRDIIGEGDEVVFDVTHSFRSLPVVMTVLLRYLAVAKGVSLGACQYGAWEARDKEANVAPVFDLTPFFALDDWTRAIHDFETFGDPAALHGIASDRLRPLCREPGVARKLNATMRQMATFASNVRLSNLGVANGETGIRNMPLLSGVAEPLQNPESQAAIPELEPVLGKVVSAFEDCGDRELRNGFRAARWAARHGLLPQAYTILQETTISFVLEKCKDIGPCGDGGIASREFVAGVLSRASSPEYDWDGWQPADTREAAFALRDGLSRDFVVNYAKLVRLRNAINHAGTNPQEPVAPQGTVFSIETFTGIAAAIESGVLDNERRSPLTI